MSVIRMNIPRPLAEVFYRVGITPNASTSVDDLAKPTSEEPDLSTSKLVEEINGMRAAASVSQLNLHPQLTQAAEKLLQLAAQNNYDTESNFESDVLEKALKEAGYPYVWVSHNALAGPLTVRGVLTAWNPDNEGKESLLNPEFTDIGVATDIVDHPENGKIGIVIQLLGKQSPARSAVGSTSKSSTQQIAEIPDSEVILALNNYRSAHKLPALNLNQYLCTYAEKRAQDLAENGGLDGHAGFKEDFSDPENPPVGISSYPRGKKIGENLAHQSCRSMTTGESFVAETGTSLIEWCFDSSTAGHKEAQLSTDFRNVCVRHASNMYVVIFGE